MATFAGRVTVDEVKEIFDTDLNANNIEAMIRAANMLVTAKLTGVGYADAELKEIERWLSAHFAAQMDPVAETEKIGDAQIRYALAISRGSAGLKLNNNPYGQQVCVLEYQGILVNLGKVAAVIKTAPLVPDA